MSLRNLKDKIVVITGAGSGIGDAAARAFAARGAAIVAADINAAGLDRLAIDLRSKGSRCITARLDVSDEADVRSFAARVADEVGAPHVLVNNAGVGFLGPFLDGDLAHWKRVMGVNLMGVVHCCHAFLPRMIAEGGERRILNVSSSAANYPVPSMAAYAASKGAVSAFSEVLKMELADSEIGVTTVCPGVINTPIVSLGGNVSPSVTEERLKKLSDYYRKVGCSPDLVARDMVRAVTRRQDILLTGPSAALVYHLKRLSLKLVRSAMIKGARQAGYL